MDVKKNLVSCYVKICGFTLVVQEAEPLCYEIYTLYFIKATGVQGARCI